MLLLGKCFWYRLTCGLLFSFIIIFFLFFQNLLSGSFHSHFSSPHSPDHNPISILCSVALVQSSDTEAAILYPDFIKVLWKFFVTAFVILSLAFDTRNVYGCDGVYFVVLRNCFCALNLPGENFSPLLTNIFPSCWKFAILLVFNLCLRRQTNSSNYQFIVFTSCFLKLISLFSISFHLNSMCCNPFL